MRFFFLLLFIFSQSLLAKKILKVRGKKIYFSTRKLNTQKGDILNVYSDGYKVGKIKVIKVKGKKGIARLLSGFVSRGDRIKASRSSRRRRTGRFKNKSMISGGIGTYKLGIFDDIDTFSLHHAITGSFMMSTKEFGHTMASFSKSITGSLEAGDPSASELDSSFWELSLDIISSLKKGVYFKYGLGVSNLHYKGTITSGANPGAYDQSFYGINAGGGIGYNHILNKKMLLQLEVVARYNYYFLAKSTTPDPTTTGSFSASFTQLNFNPVIKLGLGF